MTFKANILKAPKDFFRLRVPPGDFGIEIETEGENLPEEEVTKFFSGHQDGSLRHGMEYVSKVLELKQVEGAVDGLSLELARLGANLNPSYRSSTHIHVNYANDRLCDVLGATVLWALVEPVAFRLLPPGRDGSMFCVPSYDCGELARSTDVLCQDITFGLRGFRPRGKYSSLNLTRLGPGDAPALGTLEYRIFPSTVDGKTIADWCTWLSNMRDIVRAADDKTFVSMVDYAEKNASEFIPKIFPESHVLERQEVNHLVDFGARTAYEMARVLRQHMNAVSKDVKKKGLNDPIAEHFMHDEAQPFINWDAPAVQEAPVGPGGIFPARAEAEQAGQRRVVGAVDAVRAPAARRRRAPAGPAVAPGEAVRPVGGVEALRQRAERRQRQREELRARIRAMQANQPLDNF